MATGQLFYDPVARPLSSVGVAMPGAYYNFYVSGTSVAATVYQDPALTLPYPAASLNGSASVFSIVQADGTGAFAPIYLNPQTIYRVQLYNSTWSLVEDVDPYIPSMMTTGNGPIQIDAQGEMVINAPTPGGTGVTLTLAARTGGQALQLTAAAAGSAALIANTTVVAGSQSATFTASNKPGSAVTLTPQKWLPIQCDGALYYIPLWL
jgi:hypothetical protein